MLNTALAWAGSFRCFPAIRSRAHCCITLLSCRSDMDFYAHLLLVLLWLYRSWLAAAAVGFLSLILLFHTAIHFEDPSSTVLRYPLLTVCATLLAWWIAEPEDGRAFSPGLPVAAALFLETETGIIAAIAVTLGL